MTKLNQIVAIESGLKSRTNADVTKVYHDLQKPNLFAGISKVYTPANEDGEPLPPERTMVQRKVEDELDKLSALYTRLIDVTLTKDAANTKARGQVVIDGEVLMEAPVPFLLFLKKQLDDLRTEFTRIPVLDPSEVWVMDAANKVYRTEPSGTKRSRKTKQVLVRYPATDKHPAQTEVYDQDEIVGQWDTTKFSGAVTQSRKDVLLSRVNKLSDAVKMAVEEANAMEIEDHEVGADVFEFLLGR